MHDRDHEVSAPHSHKRRASTTPERHRSPHNGGIPHREYDRPLCRFGWLFEELPFQRKRRHGEVFLDRATTISIRGRRALNVSLAGLGVTALFRLAIVLSSGSVGLLADGIHTMTNAFIAALPWMAFALSRHSASRNSPSSYGRGWNIARGSIVLIIFLSSLFAAYKSAQKLFHPEPLRNAWWVIAAALVSFVGNEGMAVLRIRLGSQTGSAALVTNGQRARMDAWTELAVVLGAVGSALGFPLADPPSGCSSP